MKHTQEHTHTSTCDTHKTKTQKHMRHTREKTQKQMRHTQAQAQVHKHMRQTKDKHTNTSTQAHETHKKRLTST